MLVNAAKILSKRDTMLNAAVMYRQLCLPLQPGDSVKAQINRAGRACGFDGRRARSVWYGVRLWQDEYERICTAYERWLSARERELDHEIEAIRAQKTAREIRGRQHEIALSFGASRAAPVASIHNVANETS